MHTVTGQIRGTFSADDIEALYAGTRKASWPDAGQSASPQFRLVPQETLRQMGLAPRQIDLSDPQELQSLLRLLDLTPRAWRRIQRHVRAVSARSRALHAWRNALARLKAAARSIPARLAGRA